MGERFAVVDGVGFGCVSAEVAGGWGLRGSSHGFLSVARASDHSLLSESGGLWLN